MDMHHNKATRLLFRDRLKAYSFDDKRNFLLSVGQKSIFLVESYEVMTAMASAIIDGRAEIVQPAPDCFGKSLPEFLREHRNHIASHYVVDLETLAATAKFRFVDRPSTITKIESVMLDGCSWSLQVNQDVREELFGVSISYAIADAVQSIDDANQRKVKNERLLAIFEQTIFQ